MDCIYQICRPEHYNEFESSVDIVNGNELHIWEDFNPLILEQWIARLFDKRRMSERKWYSNYYKEFYENTYLLYLNNIQITNPDFWRWYLDTYVFENQ
ncbi:MAG: hypothetical protein ACFFCI_22940 [Promethearchaeota archaeon]